MATPLKLPAEFPRLFFKPHEVEDLKLREVLSTLVRNLSQMYNKIIQVMNRNVTKYVSQNSQPTPLDGETYIWKDADATSGNSTHYLVYNDNGTVVTFASEETVP